MLDLQIQSAREQRTPKATGKNHTVSFVVMGFIIVVGMIALWVMMTLLEDMRPPRAEVAPTATDAR